jgi:predicted metallopeptidase
MVRRVPELGHIDPAYVAFSFCQTRKAVSHGMYASLTPLRFAGGRTETVRGGRRWGIQRLCDESGREMLYLLNFYLPRYLNLSLREKLVTTIHELWHIGPRFDGDLRRFGGRCYAHSGSQKRYEARSCGSRIAGSPWPRQRRCTSSSATILPRSAAATGPLSAARSPRPA